MRSRYGCLGLLTLGLLTGQISAQSLEQTSFIFRRPAPCDCATTPASGPVTVMPPDATKKDQAPVVDAQAFAQAPAAGGEAGISFNPAMFGDLGASGVGKVTVQTKVVTTTTILNTFGQPVTITTVNSVLRAIPVPIIGPGSFKISDNESPRPTDRAFVTYNFFDGVNAGGQSFGLNREVIGFEKTFLGGDASFGVRLPFLQASNGGNNAGFANNEVGEITLISKFAFINNIETGNVLSGGLALTVPSADHSFVLAEGGTLRSVLFQPYAGWIINFGDFFAQGFHSVVAPTDRRDITELNNDIGVGYWVYRNPQGFLRGVVPTFEGHVYTPLNHRDSSDVIYGFNILTFTAGVNFVMPGNSTLGAGVATPVTGPRPNNVEALVSFNFRF
jgi:hypothetical protein